MSAVPITTAARALGVKPATVRRWIREGCPCESPGSAGRGRGALVDLDAVRRWRTPAAGSEQHSDEAQMLDRIAVALWDTWARDGGKGVPAHRTLGIGSREAAALLAIAFERIARSVTGQDANRLPAEIDRLRTVYLSSGHHNFGDGAQ